MKIKQQFKILKNIRPDPNKKEEFARLLAAMPVDRQPAFFSLRRAAAQLKSTPVPALLSVLFLIGSGAGISFASQSALPGDALYPTKLAIEKVRLAVTKNVEKKTELRLEFAARRLDEVEKIVTRKEDVKTSAVNAALDSYDKTLDDAGEFLRIKNPNAPDIASAVNQSTVDYAQSITDLIAQADEKEMDEKIKARLERAREHTEAKNDFVNFGGEKDKRWDENNIDAETFATSSEKTLPTDQNNISASSTDTEEIETQIGDGTEKDNHKERRGQKDKRDDSDN